MAKGRPSVVAQPKAGGGQGARVRQKRTIAHNRAARHNYEIEETWEAGIELTGTEVKSIRERPCQISDSFCIVRGGELFLVGVHIHPYSNGGVWNVDPDRRRRLLMHRRQIDAIDQRMKTKGVALVPLELYFDERNRVKLRVGMGRGKKLYDKRRDMAKRDTEREVQRALKARVR
ncbi:SsrA-binding protein SmpB [Olsenella massiliensis]|uniref:SsrA-binding protein SmpB n=1 Tax=Olsenella massiliensis TaxID=1622075 RepID=UPI0009E7EA84|nr:SsrA-binding protein SmpB [Olsenella massiliensis]